MYLSTHCQFLGCVPRDGIAEPAVCKFLFKILRNLTLGGACVCACVLCCDIED